MDKKTDVTVENIYDVLEGHKLIFDIEIKKEGKLWAGIGNLKSGGSLDGVHYGFVTKEVKTYDKTIDGILGTLMLSLGNYLSSDEFTSSLFKEVTNAGQSFDNLPSGN